MTRKIIIARMVSSNNKNVSSRFFEQSQFEQFTMSLMIKLVKFGLIIRYYLIGGTLEMFLKLNKMAQW
jgi:hypothetical protein